MAQEALHNVVKHANAHSARIELRRTGRKVRLTVEDDGIGLIAEIARGHLGLIGMQQRAERIGASSRWPPARQRDAHPHDAAAGRGDPTDGTPVLAGEGVGGNASLSVVASDDEISRTRA